MGALIDLTGQKFGKLTVLERDYSVKDKRRAYWKCQCDCGNICTVRGESLRTGHTSSCGCIKISEKNRNIPTIIPKLINKEYKIIDKKTSYKDYTGQKIGRLTVLGYNEELSKQKKRIYWNCLCDCGEYCVKRSDSFTSVPVPSCGCYKREHTSKQWAAQLEGKRFGKLLVQKKIEHNNLRSLWECKCDCGNTVIFPSRYLLSMGVKSCGCETRSNGELEIREILQKKNILFKEQFSFEDCLTENNNKIRYDFVIFNDKNNVIGIIEFNGQQHYECIEHFGGEQKFLIVQKRDEIKRDYCKKHNIPLLEIPYTELGKINIDNWLMTL